MADDREPYGRIVHEIRLAFNTELSHPRGVLPWEQRDEGQREMDMRIGSAVAVQAVHDAGLDCERMRAQLFAFGVHLPAVLDALRLAAADQEYGARARRFRVALEALGGGETQERDEKGTGNG